MNLGMPRLGYVCERRLHVRQEVRKMGGTEYERSAVVIHDVAEETDTPLDDLRAEGFSEAVVLAGESVTKREGGMPVEYHFRVAPNTTGCKITNINYNRGLPRLTDRSRLTKKFDAHQGLCRI